MSAERETTPPTKLLEHRRLKCVDCGRVLATCDCDHCGRETVYITCRDCAERDFYRGYKRAW